MEEVNKMKLGAPVFDTQPNAKSYVDKLKQKNYRAAYCPDYLVSSTQEREVNELKEELAKNDIILAEVGVWRNPLSPNPAEAEEARAYLIDRLRLADMLGARCCVNIIGSIPQIWYTVQAISRRFCGSRSCPLSEMFSTWYSQSKLSGF